ncbi:MAG: Smr/MutS family protein, partial [Firmicutes bacterium]|nr:Smr/MutS family protein [Bacillota bacterium]
AMSGFSEVRVIHGKGTGALRAALHGYLRGEGRVKSFRLGTYGEGDAGVTVIELKK